MGFNPTPEWTDKIAIDDTALTCRQCGERFEIEEDSPIINHTYYSSRHIPKKLIFQCKNRECVLCDINQTFTTNVYIYFRRS
jgi:hypothetical protein